MANLAGRNPFSALDDMDISLNTPIKAIVS